jgi:hypothetical protein
MRAIRSYGAVGGRRVTADTTRRAQSQVFAETEMGTKRAVLHGSKPSSLRSLRWLLLGCFGFRLQSTG